MSLVSDEHDDVMSLVDPKGSNSYKGVVLVEDIIDNEVINYIYIFFFSLLIIIIF
jgi:hypothetical protein